MVQAEKSKQEARTKDESVRRLEEKLQAAETKLKAKEQTCQALSEKVCSGTWTFESFTLSKLNVSKRVVVVFSGCFLSERDRSVIWNMGGCRSRKWVR